MRRVRSLDEIIAAQLADAEAAERRERRLRLSTITVHAHRWTKTIKALAALVGALTLGGTAVSIGATKLYWAARKVYGFVTLMHERSIIGPAQLPATGQPTIATDRVPEPPK